MAIYVGVNNAPKEVSSLYVGVNGEPKECTEIYAGDGDSVKLVDKAMDPPGESIFTSSGVFTIPKGYKEITAFLVGGGAGGGNASFVYDKTYMNDSGAGGGSGYTITTNISIDGYTINIAIGNGATRCAAGGVTTVGSIYAYGGAKVAASSFGAYYTRYMSGGNGGSGGGCHYNNFYSGSMGIGTGGSNGGNGGGAYYGTGQGTTTHAFGESNGTLYAGGGGGGVIYRTDIAYGGNGGGGNGGSDPEAYYNLHSGVIGPTSGMTNTGGGGGGGIPATYNTLANGASGGSGIAIIRWGY